MEVWWLPGIGFSSCAAPTFDCIQGISDRGYELSFPEGSRMEEAYQNDSED